MRGQGKFLAFWAPTGFLSFFHHKFPGISTPLESPVRDNDSNGVNQQHLISLIYVLNQYRN